VDHRKNLPGHEPGIKRGERRDLLTEYFTEKKLLRRSYVLAIRKPISKQESTGRYPISSSYFTRLKSGEESTSSGQLAQAFMPNCGELAVEEGMGGVNVTGYNIDRIQDRTCFACFSTPGETHLFTWTFPSARPDMPNTIRVTFAGKSVFERDNFRVNDQGWCAGYYKARLEKRLCLAAANNWAAKSRRLRGGCPVRL
jgi:hypothetical protein